MIDDDSEGGVMRRKAEQVRGWINYDMRMRIEWRMALVD